MATEREEPQRKALGVQGKGSIEGEHLFDAAVEDIRWGKEGETGVVMLVVVPAKELLKVAAAVRLGAEFSWVVGLVLER